MLVVSDHTRIEESKKASKKKHRVLSSQKARQVYPYAERSRRNPSAILLGCIPLEKHVHTIHRPVSSTKVFFLLPAHLFYGSIRDKFSSPFNSYLADLLLLRSRVVLSVTTRLFPSFWRAVLPLARSSKGVCRSSALPRRQDDC